MPSLREQTVPRWRDLEPDEAILTVLAPDLRFGLSSGCVAFYLAHNGYKWPGLGCEPTGPRVKRHLEALEREGRVVMDAPPRDSWKRAVQA